MLAEEERGAFDAMAVAVEEAARKQLNDGIKVTGISDFGDHGIDHRSSWISELDISFSSIQ